MSRFLYRLGRGSSARHPWRVVGAWLLIALAVFSLKQPSVARRRTISRCRAPRPRRRQTCSRTRSPPVRCVRADRLPCRRCGAHRSRSPTDIAATVAALEALDQVVVVTDPFDPSQQSLSPDGTTGFAPLDIS